MLGMNRVTLIGKLGRDPEIKTTKFGMLVTFDLAVNEKDHATGETVSIWHKIVVRGPFLGVLACKMRMGDLVLIEGALQYRTADARQGGHTIAEVVVNTDGKAVFLSGDGA